MDKKDNVKVLEITQDDFVKKIDSFLHPNIYITNPWINFLKKIVNGQFFACELLTPSGQKIYTYGFITKLGPIKAFCSPFERWNTSYIGFHSNQEIDCYEELILCLYRYLRKEKRILYFDFTDRHIQKEDIRSNKIKVEEFKNMVIDLSKDEEQILSAFEKSIRKSARNYINHGFSVTAVPFDSNFVDLYYAQLIEVFELQKLKPFYSKEQMLALCDCFKDYSDYVLCLKSFNNNENAEMGTAIYFGIKDFALTFGSASFTSQKKQNMNHVTRWEAMKYWKHKGATYFDMGGYNPYKKVFSPTEENIYRCYIQAIPGIIFAKKLIKAFFKFFRKRKKHEKK